MLFHEITLRNFLSFGPKAEPITLGPLNVLIGPNGSGKSNFLEAFVFLQGLPGGVKKAVRSVGWIGDVIYKGKDEIPLEGFSVTGTTSIDNYAFVHHILNLVKENDGIRVDGEEVYFRKKPVENELYDEGCIVYKSVLGVPFDLDDDAKDNLISVNKYNGLETVFSQEHVTSTHVAISYQSHVYSRIFLYRDWHFGPTAPVRQPQKADLPNDVLLPDASNLGLILSRIGRNRPVKRRLLEALNALYQGIDDYDVIVQMGFVQIVFHEGDTVIPSTRLSDGTLRYLCLLAILCDPDPPPLVCIEEPELGLHPDVLPTMAALLKEASERSQIIITTHSEVLVDAMHETPEVIMVTEKTENGTEFTRLDAENLKPWLERYRLGQLWSKGQIGGNRW